MISGCKCKTISIISGDEAVEYSKKHLQKISDQNGWIQLWKCSQKNIYWEATWVGGNGFYNGNFTLKKLSLYKLKKSWGDLKNKRA